jgi:flagellar biosynthetic protein FliS
MTNYKNQLAYQEAAARDASVGELVITLHDILTRDLHAAISAIEAGDLETVAAKLKHGYLALARLEGALDLELEGTEKIARFYKMSREQMLKAQAQRDPAILRQLIGFVNDMREAWVEVQGRENAEQPGTLSKISNAAYAVTEIAAAASWKA